MSQEIVEAPVPGKIIKISVQPEAKVEEGDTICEIEAMKMENPILAPVSGVVKEIKVALDEIVKTGQPLAVIEC